ncbi:MAG: hypothetical protein AB1713_01140 [Pseudomonadota bacterium]
MAINADEIKTLLKFAKAKAATDWEKNFVQDQITRFERWGSDLHISPRQIAALQKIANKESLDDDKEGDEWG